MKPKKKAISLLLAICLVAGLLPTTAFALDGDKAIQLGAGGISGYSDTNSYDYIYYGTWNDSPIKWRVLDDQTNTGSEGLFLLSDVLLGTGSSGDVYFQQKYHYDNGTHYKGSSHAGEHTNCQIANAWQGSDAQAWCKTFYSNNLTAQEQGAVLATTKSDGEFISSISYYNFPFAASNNILNGDKVFFLSAEEAKNSAYGFTDDSARIANYGNSAGYWWLRSPYAFSTGYAGLVYFNGLVLVDFGDGDWAARPAFNLNRNSVLFTSAAEGGKTDSAVDNSLTAVENYTGNEWKLTLLDSSRNFSVTETTATSAPGGTVTLNYTGATVYHADTAPNEYISVIIADDSGAQYYGRIMQPTDASGEIQITIPASLADGTYTLNVFSEQYNGGANDDTKLTDYASEFETVSLTVSTDTTAPALTRGNATRESETNATVKFTSNEAGAYFYEVVESGAAEPNIDATGAGTTCDTTEQTISLDSLTGTNAKDIYIVVKDNAGNVSEKLKITIPAYVAPVYKISADTQPLNFGTVTEGYTQAPAAKTVTITNIGNQTVTVDLPTSTNYIITEGVGFTNDTATLALNGTATFTVQPRTGLTAGSHSETLTISGSGGASESVSLSFTVNAVYTLTVNLNGGSGSTTGGTYPAGEVVNIDAGSRSNYRFTGWTTSNGGTFADASSASTTFTMPAADTTITANWQYNGGGGGSSYDYYTITASAGTGGSISPSGSVSVREDTDKTFTITPDSGYHISDVLVDGKSVGAVASYAFEDVQKKHTIEAVFAKDNPDTGVNNPFTDVRPDDWFYEAVMFVYQNGLMEGTSDTIFAPGMTTTRSMLATLLYRLEGEPAVSGAAVFTDVPAGTWYTDAVAWAAREGVVNGVGDGTAFGPSAPITREQMAVMLYRYAQYKGYDVSQGGMAAREYADYGQVSGWAQYAMDWAVAAGLITGTSDTTLSPQGQATRAEIATILMRFCERYVTAE